MDHSAVERGDREEDGREGVEKTARYVMGKGEEKGRRPAFIIEEEKWKNASVQADRRGGKRAMRTYAVGVHAVDDRHLLFFWSGDRGNI